MVKAAIILAPDEKGKQPIFGIPAIRRLTLLTLQSGLKSIYVIGRVKPLLPLLSDLLPPEAFYQVDDPSHLFRVTRQLPVLNGGQVLVMKTNHIIDRPSLKYLLDAARETGLYRMGPDGVNGREGIYVTSTIDLGPLLSALWLPGKPNPEFLDKAEFVKSISGLPYLVGDREEDRKTAEAKLVASLVLQTQESDGLLARHLDRKLSSSVSRRLSHTKVTPNQITFAGVAIGLMGALFLSKPGYWQQLAGSFLFLFCVVMDGVDGEVARLKLEESLFGHYLDIVTDNVVHVAVFLGISLGLYRETGDGRYLHLLWALLIGFGLCAVVVYFAILRRSPEELSRSPRTTQFLANLTNRDFAYLVAAFALIDRLDWFFIGATAGTYIFAAILWVMSLSEKRVKP